VAAGAYIGCGPRFGALLYWSGVGHGHKVKAQFELTEEKLAVFVDDPNGLIALPEATDELISELIRLFAEHEVNFNVVNAEEITAAVYSRPESARWSIRQIGEELGAAQVLYIEVLDFGLQEQPRSPLYQGRWQVEVKVISTSREHDVRLWPKQPMGQRVEVNTPLEQTDDPAFPVELSRRMAGTLAQKIAFFFYDHKLDDEEKVADR
jgi:hypothetical protein